MMYINIYFILSLYTLYLNNKGKYIQMTKEKVEMSLDKSKVRSRTKTNGNGEPRKMKIYFDLNKEETISYKNVLNMIKPGEESENQFIKNMFILGLNTYVTEGLKLIQAEQENKAKIEVITPNEDPPDTNV